MITHLGDINIGDVRALNGASLRIGYDFATHERPLGKATKQRLGGKLDEWQLDFKLSHQFCDPQSVLDRIKAICANGEPAPLVFDYIEYQGWVTLDSVDVTYQEVAPNGRPLVITGSLTLTEFVGDTEAPATAPAVREQGQSLANPSPVQTAMTDDVTTLLPHRQPMQHLQEALIAQHKVKRNLNDVDNSKDEQIKALVTTVNDYFSSDDWYGDDVPAMPDYEPANPTTLTQYLDDNNSFFTQLARDATVRWLA